MQNHEFATNFTSLMELSNLNQTNLNSLSNQPTLFFLLFYFIYFSFLFVSHYSKIILMQSCVSTFMAPLSPSLFFLFLITTLQDYFEEISKVVSQHPTPPPPYVHVHVCLCVCCCNKDFSYYFWKTSLEAYSHSNELMNTYD